MSKYINFIDIRIEDLYRINDLLISNNINRKGIFKIKELYNYTRLWYGFEFLTSSWNEDAVTNTTGVVVDGDIDQILTNLKRCVLNDSGSVSYYLNATDSRLRIGTYYSSSFICSASTSGLVITKQDAGFTSQQVGCFVVNETQDFDAMILSVPDSDTLVVQAPMQTVGSAWGDVTTTTTGKLTDSTKNFTTLGVTVGMVVALRDLSDYAIVTNVDSATVLSVSKDIFPLNTKYSIMRGFISGDTVKIGTAKLNGDDGQVMVEIPKYYFSYNFSNGVHTWSDISLQQRSGSLVHPAFIKADGVSERDFVYIGAFEGSVGRRNFANDVLTAYNLSTTMLKSATGERIVTSGQRAEFRTVAKNRNGATYKGWQQLDWFTNWAWQLLMLADLKSMHSQAVLGAGITNWGSTQFNSWTVNTANISPILSGWSARVGNETLDNNSGANGVVGTFLTWRGIENPYGQVWKWLDGMNVLDRRVYLSYNGQNYADNTGTTNDFFDTGLIQPSSNGYIRSIHDSRLGMFVKSVTGGSASTYIPDQYFQSTGWRVVLVGGGLIFGVGALAGFSCLACADASSSRSSNFGGRLCFKSE